MNKLHDKIVGWYVHWLRKNQKFDAKRDKYGNDITDWSYLWPDF